MRILLVDDHTLVRAGLKRILESFPGTEVVAEAEDGSRIIELVALHRPDAVVTDLSMPGRDGYQLIRDLSRQFPEVRVIVVSMHSDATRVRLALDAGAHGYVVKDAAPTELELALGAAAAGRTYLSPGLSAGEPPVGQRKEPHLSPRQREILRLLGDGLATREMAARLNISVKTVETHRARIMQALHLRRADQLLRYAVLNAGQLRAD